MRTFPKGNWKHGDMCEICKQATDGLVVLVGVAGTESDGNIQAKQIHLECIDLTLQVFKSGGTYLVQKIAD